VVDAVEAAHAAGIVHGGLTPKTVVLSAQDHVKVLDFGVAGAAWDRPAQLLSVDDGYVPPEWVLGAKWRPSWDVYSAAILLHHMLTGTPELPDWARGTSPNGSNSPVAPTQAEVRALLPGLPREAAEIWCRGLAGDSRLRPSPSELAAALRTATGS
jgi:serine/threonine-protein kinase